MDSESFTINYLNVTISINETNSINIGIHIKLTQSDLVIPVNSYQPYNQK